jgi:hypothetical protein
MKVNGITLPENSPSIVTLEMAFIINSRKARQGDTCLQLLRRLRQEDHLSSGVLGCSVLC